MFGVGLQVFQDIGDSYLISCDLVSRGRFLGRGAFGAVYTGKLTDKVSVVHVIYRVCDKEVCR